MLAHMIAPRERVKAGQRLSMLVGRTKAGVDAIVGGGVAPTRAAQLATNTIPIMAVVDDFLAQAFVNSCPRAPRTCLSN